MFRLIILLFVLILAGCATVPPPKNKENLCAIFNEYPKWYKAAKKSERKWGVPVNVQMAIIYYESAFKGDARTPFKTVCGIPTWKRISSAYGYAQALDGTWDEYLSQAGSWFAKRNKFESATDFIGWYGCQARQRLGISSYDPYNFYLAYHEGLRGYERQTYLKKPWLMAYARKVALKSQVFQDQLAYYENPYYYSTNSAPLSMPMQIDPPKSQDETLPDIEAPNYCVSDSIESETNI